MRLRCWRAVVLLLLSCMVCRKAADSHDGSARGDTFVMAGNSNGTRFSLPGAVGPSGTDNAKAAPIGERVQLEPGRDPGAALAQTIEGKALAAIGMALLPFRDVLDFSNSVAAASLAVYCDCEPEAALNKLAPSAEASQHLREQLLGTVDAITAAMRAEQRSLMEGGASKALPLAVAAVIRRLDEKPGDSGPPTQQVYQMPCDESPLKKTETPRAIAVTLIWDGLPKPGVANRFEATVLIPFLVFPANPKGKEDPSHTWSVESRKLRFGLKDGKWIKQ